MAHTSRFGLMRFGGALGGNITDEGGRFTAVDPETVDRILQAYEGHLHQGGTKLANPSGPATLALATTTGTLSANTTFYYRVAYRDQYGLETAASPEIAVTTPGPVLPPAPPTLVGAAKAIGTPATPGLRAGQYIYALSSFAADGTQSTMGSNAVLILDPGRDAIQLSLPAAPVGAASIGVWRQGPGEFGFTKIGQPLAGTTTFLDSGETPASDCACDPAHLPPLTNTTSSTNSITITAPDPLMLADTTLAIQSWVIYRTSRSGVYPANSLVAEVVTPATAPATGLVTSYVDAGGALATGAPSDFSSTLIPSQPIPLATPAVLPDITTTRQGTAVMVAGHLYVAAPGPVWQLVGLWGAATTLPVVTGVPENALFLKTDSHALYALIGGTWVQVGGGGGGGVPLIPIGSRDSFSLLSLTPLGAVLALGSEYPMRLPNAAENVQTFQGLSMSWHDDGANHIDGFVAQVDGEYTLALYPKLLNLVSGDVVRAIFWGFQVPGGRTEINYVVPPGVSGVSAGNLTTHNPFSTRVRCAAGDVVQASIVVYSQATATLDYFDFVMELDAGVPVVDTSLVPTAVQNLALDTLGNLSFDAPASTGSAPIIDYLIRYNGNTVRTWTLTSGTLTDIGTGSQTVTVAPRTARGFGPDAVITAFISVSLSGEADGVATVTGTLS